MNGASQPSQAPRAFDFELERFRRLSGRYLEHWLNGFFDLSLRGPFRRFQWISGFSLLVITAGILLNGPGLLSHLIRLFPAILRPGTTQFDFFGEAFYYLALAGYLAIPILACRYYAFEISANYLADVFDLKDVGIARTFIEQLSLKGGGQSVHVRGGKIVEEDLDSPLVKIGGPGRVIVEFDSAVLFERPDGTPHVIGPTGNSDDSEEEFVEEGDITILDGFERFRQSIDLRDHYIGNPSGEPMTIQGRSLDGFPISAADVRAVYSVRRSPDGKRTTPSKELPYPYTRRSIEDLVYQSAATVLTEGPHPSDLARPWTSAIQTLIRGAVGEFMSENNLSEYLASFGAPEVELAESQERTIQFQRYEITADQSSTTDPPVIPQPKFHPRTELSSIFSQLSHRFTQRAHYRGVDLNWIGVGTWKIPDKIASDIISGQHVQAWQINRDNVAHGSEQALEAVFNEAYLAQKVRLIQNVPLAAYRESVMGGSRGGKKALTMAYWELLGEAADLYYAAGDPLPRELEAALYRIESLLFREQHYVGSRPTKLRAAPPQPEEKTPPAPSSYKEARLYPKLLRVCDGDYKKAEWLIEYEGKKNPNLNREQVIQHLLEHPELCNI
jgi:hypothetical protein